MRASKRRWKHWARTCLPASAGRHGSWRGPMGGTGGANTARPSGGRMSEAEKGGPVVLTIRTAGFQEALSELSLLVEALDVPAEFIDGLVDFAKTPDKLARIEGLPAGAGEVGVALEPADLLLRVLAAVRAGDFDSGIFEHK